MTARFTITNLDTQRALKIEEYDPQGDMKQSLSTAMIMPNQGQEPKEFIANPGRAFLVTMAEDAAGNDKLVINPDSQQNMTVRERQDVPPVDQKQVNSSTTDGSSTKNLATPEQLTPEGGTKLEAAPKDGKPDAVPMAKPANPAKK